MSVNLQIEPRQTALTTLDGLALDVTLENAGPGAVDLPSTTDKSSVLTIYAHRGQELVRVANGSTRQAMTSGARVDDTPRLEPLASGAKRRLELDLARYQYPLPAGEIAVHAELDVPGGPSARSNTILVAVEPMSVSRVELDRSNPVLDGVAALVESTWGETREVRARLYNTRRPLAPWYSTRLELPFASRAISATPNFLRTDSFDHFFDRWLVIETPAALSAVRLLKGTPTGERRDAGGTAGFRLLAALCTEDQRLLVFLRAAGGELGCYELTASGLTPLFGLPTPPPGDVDPVIGGLRDRIVIGVAREGLERLEMSYAGQVLSHARLFNTELRAFDLAFDPVDDALKAGFWDGARGEHLQLVGAAARIERPRVFYRERVGALRDVLEIGWDVSPAGEFHVAASTPEGVYYWSQRAAPSLVFPGGQPRRPRVIAQKRAYLGLLDMERGYNFYEYRNGLELREGAPR